ncbi:hypothetical protein [Thalassolituus sp.]|nr:hypothetical protein [Thalassolituus sp.]MDQ4425502.1 hypothetical protein [Thalassolituus sp.]
MADIAEPGLDFALKVSMRLYGLATSECLPGKLLKIKRKNVNNTLTKL